VVNLLTIKSLKIMRIFVVLLILSISFGCSISPKNEVKHDIANNNLKIRTFGYPVAWLGEYARLLKSRLNVELVPVAGCVVTNKLVEDVNRYNTVTKSEIKRRFGDSILDDLEKEAKQNYEKSRLH